MKKGVGVVLGESFYDDLTGLIDKYSGMEMTNAECVGYLMFKVNELMTQRTEDERGDLYE